MKQPKIIDNFLSKEDFVKLRDHMMGPEMDWYYNSFIAKPENKLRNDPYDFQFTHTFYLRCFPRSQFIHLLDPILIKINPSAIVRIKANLLPRTEKIVTHEYHLDHDHYDGKIAIFYVNTNNGFTIFEDGTKIESVENRLCVFDGNILHTGTSCTDEKTRCVINFMFYQWTDQHI